MADVPTICPNCGGDELTWDAGPTTTSGIVDGRLCMHDIVVQFWLGCDWCSETIAHRGLDDVLAILNGAQTDG